MEKISKRLAGVLAATSSEPSAERAKGRTDPDSKRVKDESGLVARDVARDFPEVTREAAKEFAGAAARLDIRGLPELLVARRMIAPNEVDAAARARGKNDMLFS